MLWESLRAAWLDIWPVITAIGTLLIAVIASSHVILKKRETGAAVAWVGLIWLAPIVGTLVYILIGINRIQRRAYLLRQEQVRPQSEVTYPSLTEEELREHVLKPDHLYFDQMMALVDQLTRRRLLGGNEVKVFQDGDTAYREMLKKISEAQYSITLSTYIFDHDRAGKLFLRGLEEAVRRGVEVRVLIDGVGARYSFPSITRFLSKRKIPYSVFLPARTLGRIPYLNLRNHRKLLVVDGKVGFTGGMNIREGHALSWGSSHPIQDLHFYIQGPAVTHLQEVFAEDWIFAANEHLQGDTWFPKVDECGLTFARGVSDGPDEDIDKLPMTLLGAINQARYSLRIVTPYFLPDSTLTTAIQLAAMRGVKVDIIVPEKGNLPFVSWASNAHLQIFLEGATRIWKSPPPFDHSKLFIVDGLWSLIGSSNWDPRSLRINFEFNMECYDRNLADQLNIIFETKLANSRQVKLNEIINRAMYLKLRDGLAKLFSPYL